MREKLAELCHKQWSRWMEYLFSKCYETQIEPTLSEPDGEKVLIIPRWAIARWKHQMKTKYQNLSEDEKESDRKEADRFLALIEENQHEEDKMTEVCPCKLCGCEGNCSCGAEPVDEECCTLDTFLVCPCCKKLGVKKNKERWKNPPARRRQGDLI